MASDQARRGRRVAMREAVPWAAMSGLTEPFMVPYALALGAGAVQAGLLLSGRQLLVSLVQLKTSDAAAWLGSRKRIVLLTGWLQAALWVPLAVVGPLFGSWAVAALMVLYTLGSGLGAFGQPAWGSMMGDYLAPEERGRFLGARTRLLGLATVTAGLLGGGLLHLLRGRPLLGFGLLCAAAWACRLLSCWWLTHSPEASCRETAQERQTAWAFLRRMRRDVVPRFTVAMALFSVAAFVASSYWTVFLLRELHYDYLTYTVVVMAGQVVGFLMVARWGRVSDRVGNCAIVKWTATGASVLPFLWGWFPHPLCQLSFNMLGGFLWSGLSLAMTNFIYDAVAPGQRTRYLGYFSAIQGLGAGLGVLAGGWLLTHVPRLGGSEFAGLFLCSGLLRVAASAMLRRTLVEVRDVEPAGPAQVLFDVVGERPLALLGLGWLRRDP